MTQNIQLATHEAVPAPSASARWLAARGLRAPESGAWRTTILLDVVDPWGVSLDVDVHTRLQITIEASGWGVVFCRGRGSSSLRVTTAPRVHQRDDFGLLPHITELGGLGAFVHWLERRFQIQFRRPDAVVYTDLPCAQSRILLWIVAAL
jgi:hypothetical protein